MAHLNASYPELLRQAVTAHQSGNLAVAERGYRAILDIKPDDFDTLYLLAVVRYQH